MTLPGPVPHPATAPSGDGDAAVPAAPAVNWPAVLSSL
jgi:hypothetical protein